MMDGDMKRRIVHGMLSLVLGSLAAWLSTYLTNKILGEPDD
jgi:energy-converting hydrogenase Eha subunit A